MPIYEYACRECEHTLDALQKMTEPPLVECPACGAASLRRLLSAPRFRLKGQGWYETDFKKEGQRNLAGDVEAKKADSKPADDAPKKDAAKSTSSSDSDKSTT